MVVFAFVAGAVWAAPAVAGGQFSFTCQYSHSLADDLIVFPGQPGASHLHDFLGNRSTNASSTYSSLRAASTTCPIRGDTEADKSAYWFPTLLERHSDGAFAHRRAYKADAYYLGNSQTEPFPEGMRMIAGDSRATAPQPFTIVHWDCISGVRAVDSTRPWCIEDYGDPYPPQVRMEIRFPDCWDGVDSDWNYTPHMTYHTPGDGCPAGYPRHVPQIHMFVYYSTPGGPDADEVGTVGAVKLSSGGHFTAHGDFFNGWDPLKLSLLVRQCIHLDLC